MARCALSCGEQHTYRYQSCALAPPPEPTVSILRVEDGPDGERHIATRSIPLTAWEALVKVAMWVSRGRSFALDADPDIYPTYPDAAARRALGALHDAGLLPMGSDQRGQQIVRTPTPPAGLVDHLAGALDQAFQSFDPEQTEDAALSGHLATTVLAALEEFLAIGDADAWCKICRRVWDGKHHQCESDAEQRLASVRGLADRLDEFAENALKVSDRQLYAAIARDVRSRVDGDQPGPAGTVGTVPREQS